MSKEERKLKAKVDEYFEKYWSVSFEKFIENWEETSEALEYKDKEIERLKDQLQQKENIIKEVREYIKDKWEMELKDSMEDFLDHDELIDRKRLLHILEILNKVD